MITRRKMLTTSVATGALALADPLPRALAQSGARSSKLVVGFPAGGSIDVVARLLVDQLRATVPNMIVDNRAGAGGRTVLEELKLAPADGSVVGLSPAGMLTLFPHIYKKMGYDPIRDLAAVTPVCSYPFVLTVGPLVPVEVHTLRDLMTWCRANPKLANYATPGTGSLSHFIGMMLSRATQSALVHVPYKGGAPAIQDLLGGHLAMSVGTLATALPSIQSGAIRALAITAPARTPLVPNIPTIKEAGFPDLEATEWFGVFLPGGASAALVSDLNQSIRHALKAPSIIDGFAKQALVVDEATPEAFAARIKSDLDKWGAVVKAANFAPLE